MSRPYSPGPMFADYSETEQEWDYQAIQSSLMDMMGPQDYYDQVYGYTDDEDDERCGSLDEWFALVEQGKFSERKLLRMAKQLRS